MKIHIEELEIFCIIGLLDFEREVEQKVLLTLEINYPYQKNLFLDYSRIVSLIEENLKQRKYLLLEEALGGIKTLLFQHFSNITHLKIKISKPDILPHCSVGLSDTWTNTPQ